MAPYEIRIIGDPVLKQQAAEVADIDANLVRLADAMVETMYAAPGIGLAAPQVGIQKRLFVWDLDDGTGSHAMINPRIVESDGEWTYVEGCLSVPGFYETVSRPQRVTVSALDRNGEPFTAELDGLAAICLQHEVDHLNGKLFVDYLSPLKRQRIRKKLEKDQRSRA